MRIIAKKIKTGMIAFVLIALFIAFCGCSLEEDTIKNGAELTTVSAQANEDILAAEDSADKSILKTQNSGQLSSTEKLAQSVINNFIEEGEDGYGYRQFDLTSMNLKATIDSDELLNEIMQKLIPSFEPTDYRIRKNAINDTDRDYFQVYYTVYVGEYRTFKGYSVTYESNQAVNLHENGVFLSIPPASVINNLPVITEEIKQAAYQQGQEDIYTKNKNFVVQEQSGNALLDLDTNECFYVVTTVYTVSAESHAKGAIGTKYMIPNVGQ